MIVFLVGLAAAVKSLSSEPSGPHGGTLVLWTFVYTSCFEPARRQLIGF